VKGSLINRYVKEKPGKPFKPTQTLKDKNLLKINTERMWLNFTKIDRNQIMSTLKEDVALL
jgi:hypothetical protein